MPNILKTVINDLINERTEQAQAAIHQYILDKTQRLAGLNRSTLTEGTAKYSQMGSGFYLCDKKPILDEDSEGLEGIISKLLGMSVEDVEIAMRENDQTVLKPLTSFYVYGSMEHGVTNGHVQKLIDLDRSPYVISREPENAQQEKQRAKKIDSVVAKLVSLGMNEKDSRAAVEDLVADASQCLIVKKLGTKFLLLAITND